jgi:hypothetical protein
MVVTFAPDDAAKAATATSIPPPIWNRSCDLATLRHLQVDPLVFCLSFLPITLQGRIAPFLLKSLQAELEHETKPDLVRCRRDPDVRDTCGELS